MTNESQANFLSADSLELLSKSISTNTRVIITGAGGWLGRTSVLMFRELGVKALLLGSTNKVVDTPMGAFQVQQYSREVASSFQPTLLLDFAFLTRDLVESFGLNSYVAINRQLITQASEIAMIDSVEQILFCSSGAAVHVPDKSDNSFEHNPYGFLKRETQDIFEKLSHATEKKVLGMRPWSITGPLITKPTEYAFSSLILGARAGVMEIKSSRKVLRRFISADDLIAVCLGTLFQSGERFSIIDSGGELVDLIELAQQINMSTGGSVRIKHSVDDSLLADTYYSDNYSWTNAVGALGFNPQSLSQQIQRNFQLL